MPPPGGQSKPVFATAPYAADEHGVLRGVLSPRCVFASASETCALFVAHYRPRLTGPGFPVAVWGARFIPFSAAPRIRPWQDPRRRRTQGRCLTRSGQLLGVLLALTVDADLLDGVLTAGTVTGLWAPPRRWDAVRGT